MIRQSSIPRGAWRWLPIRGAVPCAAIVVVAALAVSGCSGDAQSSGGQGTSANAAMSNLVPAKFSEIYPMMFPRTSKPQCNNCHGRPADEVGNGNLNMGTDPASAYAALVGKKTPGVKCSTGVLVVPGDPSSSLFLQKLSPNPPCGDQMPVGGAPLADAQLGMIRSWIAAGAPND
jgi:hypothetical protein